MDLVLYVTSKIRFIQMRLTDSPCSLLPGHVHHLRVTAHDLDHSAHDRDLEVPGFDLAHRRHEDAHDHQVITEVGEGHRADAQGHRTHRHHLVETIHPDAMEAVTGAGAPRRFHHRPLVGIPTPRKGIAMGIQCHCRHHHIMITTG